MKKIVLLVFSLWMLSGCMMDSGKLLDKMIESHSDIKSYEFEINANFDYDMLIDEENTVMSMEMKTEGKMDYDNEKMQLKGKVTTAAAGMDTSMVVESYYIEDYAYTKVLGKWTKSKLEEGMWEMNDQMKANLEQIKESTLDDVKKEKALGLNYYVLYFEPDFSELMENLGDQKEMLTELLGEDYEKAFKNVTMTAWVNTKTFKIERMVNEFIIDTSEISDEKIKMKVRTEIKYSNYNSEMDIVLPKDAVNAKEYDPNEALVQDYFGEDTYEPPKAEARTFADCEKLTSSDKDWCYEDVAVAEKDPSLCLKVSDYSISFCLTLVDEEKKLPLDELESVCASIRERYTQESCYSQLAIHRQEPSLCKHMIYSPDFCLKESDEARKTPISLIDEICGAAEDEYDREFCYYELGVYRLSKELCEKAGSQKELCLEDIA